VACTQTNRQPGDASQ